MNKQPVLITLGSNIAPEQNLRRAVRMLKQNYRLEWRAVSPVYESAPVDAAGGIATDQPLFLNAAALVETDFYQPYRFKFEVLRFLERCLGRVRTADKFTPRPIDLDLALFGEQVLDQPGLCVPDPDILTRAHVALPLADLAPDLVHPITGQTLAEIAAPLRANTTLKLRPDFLWED